METLGVLLRQEVDPKGSLVVYRQSLALGRRHLYMRCLVNLFLEGVHLLLREKGSQFQRATEVIMQQPNKPEQQFLVLLYKIERPGG